MEFHAESVPPSRLSRVAAERYAQLSAVAQQRADRRSEPRIRRLVRLVRSKLA